MKRSYSSGAETRRSKRECGQNPQIVYFVFTQTPRPSVNAASAAAAAPLPAMSFTSFPRPSNNTVQSAQMHQTILKRGQDPLLSIERCSVCCNMFHCKYCTMVHKHLHEAQNHVANHIRNAVQREGFVIIKCGRGCRQTPHFHCCYCTSTLIRRDALIKHLTTCKNISYRQPPPTAQGAAAPPSTTKLPPSPAERLSSEVPPSPTEGPLSTEERPPSPTEGPLSTEERPPSLTEEPPSPAEGLPSTAEIPPSPLEVPPSTAEIPPSPSEGPPSPLEVPPSTAEMPPSPTDGHPSERPPSEGPPSPSSAPAQMHQTILKRGQDPLLSIERCSVCCNMFHCKYCTMVHKHLHEAQNHVANHIRNAVQQEGFVIIKCGLDCRQTPHFHCCYCTSTLIRRDALIKHLTTCEKTSYRQPPSTAPGAAPPKVPPSEEPPSTTKLPPSEVPPSTVKGPPLLAERPSSPTERPPERPLSDGAPSPLEGPPFPAAPLSSAVRLRVRQQVRVACTHCGIQINKRNLLVHIKRKHRLTTLLGRFDFQ